MLEDLQEANNFNVSKKGESKSERKRDHLTIEFVVAHGEDSEAGAA
jgi:hypothetical protein